jgi:glutamate dehydrogenase
MAVESLDLKNTKEREQDNSLIEFQETLKEAVKILNYPPQVFEFLKKPMRFLEVSIPVRMDNGQTEIFQGYRAQHWESDGHFDSV